MIATLEDAVIAVIKNTLTNHVRSVDSLPGPWSLDLLRRMFQEAPAVYITWLGGSARAVSSPLINSRLDVLSVTRNARGEKARRRGDGNTIGAYDILQMIIPQLHNYSVDDVGALELSGVRNVFDNATFEVGATVYAASFTVPVDFTPAAGIVDPSTLDDFLTYHESHEVGDVTDEQQIDLPGASSMDVAAQLDQTINQTLPEDLN